MIGTLIDIVSWAALVAGAVFYVIGAVGLMRMPDVFTRMHATSVSDTLGLGLMTFGMILQAGLTLVAVKLVFILVLIWATGAVATHALIRAALHDGLKPLLAGPDGRLRPTDVVDLYPELRARLVAPLSDTPDDPGQATAEDAEVLPQAVEDKAGVDAGARTSGERRAKREAGSWSS